jgi:uncharacterized protein (TIGR03086 family)
MDVIDQLEIIVPDLIRTTEQVRLDQFDNDTPCAQYKVRDLYDHLIGGASQFAPQLRGETPGPFDPSVLEDADRKRLVVRALEDLLDAAKSPGALGRTVSLPFGDVPGSVLASFLTLDGMTHTWDVARSTGQEYRPDEELAEEVLATAHALIAPEMRDGDTFAAEASAPEGADAVTRLAAFTGRTV